VGKKLILLLMVGLVSISLAFLSCAPEAPAPTPPTPPTPPPAEKPPIKIGAIYWEAGELKEFTDGNLGCINLAVKEINEKGGILGGRKIQILQYDEGFSAEVGVASVKKAIADGCEAIIGFQDSTAGLPSQGYCREQGIILTTTGAGTKELTRGTYPGYFRSGFMCQASDRARARWCEEMGFKTIVYLAVDSKYCIDALDDYKSVWDRPESPVELVDIIWIPYGSTEAKVETTKAVGHNPDFIFGNTWGDSVLVSQASTIKDLGYKGTWTICYDVMMDGILKTLGPLADGSWHCFNYLYDPAVPENARFHADFKAMNPTATLHGFAEAAYEGMWCMAMAIDRAGGTTDLQKYDQELQGLSGEWMTPRGQMIEILSNRESFHPVWSNWYRENQQWTNKMPMEILKEDYFLK